MPTVLLNGIQAGNFAVRPQHLARALAYALCNIVRAQSAWCFSGHAVGEAKSQAL